MDTSMTIFTPEKRVRESQVKRVTDSKLLYKKTSSNIRCHFGTETTNKSLYSCDRNNNPFTQGS